MRAISKVQTPITIAVLSWTIGMLLLRIFGFSTQRMRVAQTADPSRRVGTMRFLRAEFVRSQLLYASIGREHRAKRR